MKTTTDAQHTSILLEAIERDDLFFAMCDEIRNTYKLWRMVTK